MRPDEINNLERDVELDLARWADRLNALPSNAALQAAQTVARIELETVSLVAQPGPGVLKRVRAAVAAELAGAGARRDWWLQRWLATPSLGSLSAAAMLLVCVGVGWYASTLTTTAPQGNVEMILAALPETSTDPILSEVRSLADRLNTNAALESDDDDESLTDLVREMDRLLAEPESDSGATPGASPRRGVMG